MPNSPTHFEIPADDVQRAKAFYEKTFGWKITAFPMPPGQEYWGVSTMKEGEAGINGGLMQRKNAGQPFTNYISVTSIDVMTVKVQANGGTVVLPKQEIGQGMGWIAAFLDPENNLIGLHQMGPAAAAAAKPARKAASRKAKPARRAAGKSAKKAGKKAGKKKRK
jgi:predicted enzyme related to lactoylglutathione lyase